MGRGPPLPTAAQRRRAASYIDRRALTQSPVKVITFWSESVPLPGGQVIDFYHQRFENSALRVYQYLGGKSRGDQRCAGESMRIGPFRLFEPL